MFLVAILIVLALFGYLYFFTDMIRSHKEPQQEAELLVRKPLPRKGGPMGAMTTSKKPAVTGTTTAKPEEKPAATPPKPKPSVATRPVGGAAKPVPPAASPSAKPQPQKVASPAVSPVKPAARPETAAGSQGKYVVLCGPFVSTREQVTSRSAIKKAGLTPVSSRGPKQPTLMYRLFVAGYSDASVAANERNKLLESTPDAFVLLNDGNYELFAGSYHEEGRAVKLRDRLAARGIKTELRQVTAPVATRMLSAGAFPTREAAGAVAERLKKDGIVCIVIKRGR
jgi:cell division protein FtsN